MSRKATNDGRPNAMEATRSILEAARERERWAEAVRASAGLPITPDQARADLDAGLTVEQVRAKYGEGETDPYRDEAQLPPAPPGTFRTADGRLRAMDCPTHRRGGVLPECWVGCCCRVIDPMTTMFSEWSTLSVHEVIRRSRRDASTDEVWAVALAESVVLVSRRWEALDDATKARPIPYPAARPVAPPPPPAPPAGPGPAVRHDGGPPDGFGADTFIGASFRVFGLGLVGWLAYSLWAPLL